MITVAIRMRHSLKCFEVTSYYGSLVTNAYSLVPSSIRRADFGTDKSVFSHHASMMGWSQHGRVYKLTNN